MKRVLRWIGIVLGAVIAVVAIAAVVIVVDSNRQIAANVAPVPPPTVLGHADVARGRHLFNSVTGCADCHRADAGGGPFVNEPVMMVLNAPNLTRGPGGVGVLYSDADYDRAIRRGVRPDGTRLLIMPSWDYAALSDDDAASVIAYLRSVPPVDRASARVQLGPIGRVLIATKKIEFDATRLADEGPPASPAPQGVTPQYGAYLARIGGCLACHGAHLSGGHFEGSPSDPPAANITPTGIGSWTKDQFVATLRTGKDPAGHALNPFMPWRLLGTMTDDELTALYDYLKTVPPRPTGNG